MVSVNMQHCSSCSTDSLKADAFVFRTDLCDKEAGWWRATAANVTALSSISWNKLYIANQNLASDFKNTCGPSFCTF